MCSPIIAQAVLESASGVSELAKNAHNYFGLKYRAKRCPSACGVYYKVGSEQNKDGTYTSSAMQWMKFPNMEAGVQGYFDFINISNYSNLKGVTDPKAYLENIKKDGYATSINYVQNNLNVINKYNLTKYDVKSNTDLKGPEKMKINIHAGHNPDGKIACGAVGLIKESTEARIVKDKVISMLKSQGHTVYDCTVDNGTSQNDVLKKIVSKCNTHAVDLDISIHFNSGANDRNGNGFTTGTEIFIYNSNSKAKPYAQKIVRNIANLGFKLRDDAIKDDVKNSSYLYVLKNTKSPSVLIEVCFVDDADDVKIYNADKVAQAIVKGITGISSIDPPNTPNPILPPLATKEIYRVRKSWNDSASQIGAYSSLENAKAACKSGYYVFDSKGNVVYPKNDSANNSQPSTAYNHTSFVRDIQKAIGAKVDGIPGNETLSKTVTVSKSKNNKHAVVRPIQKYLNSIGYNCGNVDGVAGSKFDSAVKAFQKANGCVVDGEITSKKNTWKKLLKLS